MISSEKIFSLAKQAHDGWDIQCGILWDADRNSSRVQCNYCHRWGHMKFTCYRRLKVCFGCHLPGHYLVNCEQKFRQPTQFAARCLFERDKFCGGGNRAREHWQGYTTGSRFSNMSRCEASLHGGRVSNSHYVRASPSEGIIGAAAASCKSRWVGPTTVCTYIPTAEQANFGCWLREHQSAWHSDRPAVDVTLALSAPLVAEELSAELSTTLLVADVKPAGKLNEVKINEMDLDVVSQGRPKELDIVVDSGAVIVSNLVNYVLASVNSPMKPIVCTC